MHPQSRIGFALAGVFPSVLITAALAASPAPPVDYARQVKPVLARRCYACHGGLKQLGGLRLDTGALMRSRGVVVPGKPAASRLLTRITAADPGVRMPPEGEPLKPEEVAALRSWIAEGARAPSGEQPEADPRRHWAFLRPVRPPVPRVRNRAWVRNPIDAFVAAEHEQRGLQPAPPASKETLLRRVYLDLTGLPPGREELHSFLADSSPDAYEKVVDRLLASSAYGERWGRHWMDVWRYSDWYGRRQESDVRNSYGQIWRWRDWIVSSLNADHGYDQMVTEMLAGDEVAPADHETAVATGFLVRNRYSLNYNQWMRDNVEHTGKAFLGLTLNCAHCHDHKYDPISQRDYFRFRAFFEPLELRHDRWPGDADPGPFKNYVYGGSTAVLKSGMIRVFDEKLDATTRMYRGGDEREVMEEEPPVQAGVPAVFRSNLRIQPVELPPAAYYPGMRPFIRQEELARREAALAEARSARPPDPLRVAAAEAGVASMRARIGADDARYGNSPDAPDRARAASRAERLYALRAAEADFQAVRIKAEATPADAALQKARQEAEQRLATARVEAAKPESDTYTPLSPVYPTRSTGRRLALARWIASPDNPLTARVAVNHIWLRHFGRPLVDSVFDFGRNGKRPSHPELLDWLAATFAAPESADARQYGSKEVETVSRPAARTHFQPSTLPHSPQGLGWSMKRLHRLIVTSSTYRMASGFRNSVNARSDRENRYLWRFNHRRLESEAVRDSLLAATGTLDRTMGGPELDNRQEDTRRRSLYYSVHPEANGAMRFLATFDAPDVCDGYRRSESIIPQQALALTNSRMSVEQARVLAARLWKELGAPPDPEGAFINAAFEQVLTRRPTAAEGRACRQFLRQQLELFRKQAGVTPASAPGPRAAEPLQRAGESLVQALFSHDDFLNLR